MRVTSATEVKMYLFELLSPSEWRFLTVAASVTALGYALWLSRNKWLYIIPVDGYPRTRTQIIFDDLFHNVDPLERYSITVFGGVRSGVRDAKRAINDDLKGIVEANPGITPRELFSMWCSFGEKPTVSGSGFDAYDYAKKRAQRLGN